MNEESKNNSNEKIKAILLNSLCPYIVSLVGAILTVGANFIKYITLSNWFYSRKVSYFQWIMEALDRPDLYLASIGNKVALGLILTSTFFAVLAVISAFRIKMKSTIAFALVGALIFLMANDAWIHLIGSLLTIIGAIWYLIVKKINPTS